MDGTVIKTVLFQSEDESGNIVTTVERTDTDLSGNTIKQTTKTFPEDTNGNQKIIVITY